MQKGSLRLAAMSGILIAACAINAPLAASSVAEISGIKVGQNASQVSRSDASRSAELAFFDYGRFVTHAHYLRLPRQMLAFTVTVGADGKVSECTFAREFRSAFTPAELCDRLKLTMKFRPARDAQGKKVSDVYSNEVMIWSFVRPDR
ncbi:hypothetical protein [Erythrobacter sp.]|uniref:hypothetical protein n=1 Tax=Erythrobacter sp. TaxID=1042 RepID=UPI0025DD6D12|nr:hypothetical protein [Erythrobacter sp.]